MNNRIAAHLNCYHTHRLQDALRGITSAGFRFVELGTEHVPLDARTADVTLVLRLLRDLDLIPTSFSGHSDLTTRDGLRDGLRAVDLCATLDVRILNTFVGGNNDADRGGDEGKLMANIAALARGAAEHNIVVALETHGQATGSGRALAELVRRVNLPNVRINYDTANVEYYAGVAAIDDLASALPLVVHCHVKDKIGGVGVWNFPALGEGHVDFRRVFEQFNRVRYTGPFSVEIEFTGEPWPDVEAVTHALRQSRKHLKWIGVVS